MIALSTGMTAGLAWVIRAGDSPTADVIAQSVGNAVASILTIPFAATALVALYFDLRIRAEAFDVQMMIARLDKGARPTRCPRDPPPRAGRRSGLRTRRRPRHPRRSPVPE